jgi:response regulator RpfG family c-di-GMP phosphodiesterase
MAQLSDNDLKIEKSTLLFVDDEASILSSLKRLFRPFGYRVLTAESGAAALVLMDSEAVDLVVSDMRMPEMNGAQFLEQVSKKWPETIRILLTGYADISSTIDAINKGQIYRYVAKPWEDGDITITIRQALEHRALECENGRLQTLTRVQNEELKDLNAELKLLNANLEDKVRSRTEELRQTLEFLELSHNKLKKSFMASIKTLSNLIELRCGSAMIGHAKIVGENARNLAQRLNMPANEVQDLVFACLLKDIGKISLPDSLLAKPVFTLEDAEMAILTKHPIRGEAALLSLEQLEGAAKIIRSQHEQFDGGGFPDRISGFEIPLSARILAVVNDFESLQMGMLLPRKLSQLEAIGYLNVNRGKRYDPTVVDTFVSLLNIVDSGSDEDTVRKLRIHEIHAGMTVAKDLFAGDGILLLMRGRVLDEKLIDMLRSYEKSMGDSLRVYVQDK